jgi:exodeoxyribonuclease X
MRSIRIIDLETTGLEPGDEVVEVGAIDLDCDSGEISAFGSRTIRPRNPIPPQASAVHHITDADVVDAPASKDVWPQFFNADCNIVAFAAHNASFESRWLDDQMLCGKPLICTYKAALRIWGEAPGHTNQVLRYWLKLPLEPDRAAPPHRALPDAYVTAHLLRQQLTRATLSELISWSGLPALLTKVTFGKHRGLNWTDVPDSYLDWIICTAVGFDENVIHTAKTVRAGRRASAN